MADVRTDYRIGIKDDTRRGASSVKRSLDGIKNSVKGIAAFAGVGGLVGAGGLLAIASSGIRDLEDYNRRIKQTEQLIKQTGASAGLTADEISSFADALARTTLASETGVLDAANQLLTFRSISGDTFKETLTLAQDLASLGFGSITSATQQLAKALDDPIRGLSQLRRVGVSFSQDQTDFIKSLVEGGEAAKAQTEILKVLRDQIGGSGAAAAEGTLSGAVDTLGQNWRELKRELAEGTAFDTAISGVNLLNTALDKIRDFFSIQARVARINSQIENFQDLPLGLEKIGFFQNQINDLIIERESLLQQELAQGQQLLANKRAIYDLEQETNQQKNETERQQKKVNEQLALEASILKDLEKAWKELQQPSQQFLDDQALAEQIISETLTPLEVFQQRMEDLKRLFDQGFIDGETLRRGTVDAMEDLETQTKETKEEVEKLDEVTKELELTFSSAFEDAIVDLKDIDDIFKALINDVIRLAARILIIQPLLEDLKKVFEDIKNGGGSGGNANALFGNFLGDIFAGFFQKGGFIPPGKVGIAGEAGPEPVFGGRSGVTVAPNSALGGQTTINFEIKTNDAGSFRESMAENRDVVVGIVQEAMRREGREPNLSV